MKLLFTCVLVVVASLLAQPAYADTGQLREVVTESGINVVVFTAPTPLRAGQVEVAVLVTDAQTGAPLKKIDFLVAVRQVGWDADTPSMQIAGGPDPGNRLAQKAVFDLPEPGSWELLVEVRHEGRVVPVGLTVVAGEAMPRWWQVLPVALLGLPFAALVVARDRLRHSD